MKVQNKEYYYINSSKEAFDTQVVVDKIKTDRWVDSDTILVNCSPEYSSILTQNLNHRLSHMIKDELFEVLPFEMPYPIMNQVWNSNDRNYEKHDYYVKNWLNKYIYSGYKYLFISSGKHNFDKLKLSLQGIDYKLCSLYVEYDRLVPDYYGEIYYKTQGSLLYSWENVNNPNWHGQDNKVHREKILG